MPTMFGPDLNPLWEILRDMTKAFNRLAKTLEQHNEIEQEKLDAEREL